MKSSKSQEKLQFPTKFQIFLVSPNIKFFKIPPQAAWVWLETEQNAKLGGVTIIILKNNIPLFDQYF